MSDSLDHAIEEVVAREFAGRDWVRNTRTDAWKQTTEHVDLHTHRERENNIYFSIIQKGVSACFVLTDANTVVTYSESNSQSGTQRGIVVC